MPDGKTIVTDGFAENDGDLNYRDSNIYAVDVATGARKRLTPERGRWTTPVVSPDGSKIAFAGHPFTKQTYHTQDLMLMNADGSGVKNISGGMDRDPGFTPPIWAPDGSGLFISPEDKGSRNVVFMPVDGSGPKPVTTGAQVISLGGISKTGVLVGTRSMFTSPEDVVKITRKAQRRRRGAAHQRQRGPARRQEARDRRGDLVHLERRRQGPGLDREADRASSAASSTRCCSRSTAGPHGMYSVGFDYMWQTWAANGYVVLYTNPRGSTGYGTAFGNAIDQAYPAVDYDDLMAGVDSVVARGYVDKSRMYVAGCSGGGVLSSWVIGHTDRFAGAAVRCPVTNWLSFAGQSDVPLFTHNFFGAPFWEKPEQWLKQSSIMYVGNVKTPTVIMTGNLDLRTPMPQSEEYFSALKVRGIPTTLLRFENEWHGTESVPSNWMRTQLYMMSWFSKYPGKQP